jgi:hypothetical protein
VRSGWPGRRPRASSGGADRCAAVGVPEVAGRCGAVDPPVGCAPMTATRHTRAVLVSALPVLAPLLVGALLAGCGEGAAPPPLDPVVRDSADAIIHEFPTGALEQPAPFRLAEVPAVRIGVTEGASEYQWTRPVAAARLPDGGFAVLEQVPAEVRLFDGSGRFLGRVGAAGDGPGEFRSPAGLLVPGGDTILVWDRAAARLSWFSIDGSLIRDRTLREPGGIRTLRRVALTAGGVAVVLGAVTTEEELGNQGRIRETWQVVPVGPDGEADPSLGSVRGTERVIDVARSASGEVVAVQVQGRWWWGEGFASASRRGVWTADRLRLEARHFDLERGLDRIVRIQAEDRPFTAALIDSLHGVELDRVEDPEIRELWEADFEERDYPESVPPVGSVFGDAAGRLWIGLTEAPPQPLLSGAFTAIRRWVLFEENAGAERDDPAAVRLLGVVDLPPGSHPLWADAEGVLLVRIDPAFDVPYVEWYGWVGEPTPLPS